MCIWNYRSRLSQHGKYISSSFPLLCLWTCLPTAWMDAVSLMTGTNFVKPLYRLSVPHAQRLGLPQTLFPPSSIAFPLTRKQEKQSDSVRSSRVASETEDVNICEDSNLLDDRPGLCCALDKSGTATLADLQDGLHALCEPDRLQVGKDLQKCASLDHVRHFHHYIMSVGLWQDTHLSNVLISMYAKHNAIRDSVAVFHNVVDRTVVTWTAMITAYVRRGQGKDALMLYNRMKEEGKAPNNVTYISLLGACTVKETLVEGKKIHACLHNDQLQDVIVGTALITMYGRCGSIKEARAIFDQLPSGNVVTWNAMITAYVDHEQGKEAIRLFQLLKLTGLDPNDCTYINSLRACAILEDIVQGRAIHTCIVEDGLISDIVVANALINMYGKCGIPNEAHCIFSKLQVHDLVTWNGIITAYAQQGFGAEAMDIFRNMRQQGVKPDKVTFISVISACSSLAALEEGKWIHANLLAEGIEYDVQVGNALIHMYGKCGALYSARTVFDKIRPRNVISWTAIIAAFSQQGHAKAALQLYKEMQEERIKPDEVTYITLLSACSHAGLVEEGRSCFLAMENDYHLTPKVEHYVCMIDLFGRAGMLTEAEEFIRKMPTWPDGRLWSALLASCKIHSDTFLGKHAAEQMINLVPKDTSPYVLLSNLYAVKGKQECTERIHGVMDKVVDLFKGWKT